MNALRQEAFRMMESMPDEGMADLIRYMNEYHRKFAGREQRQYDAREKAFTVLESMKRKVPSWIMLENLQNTGRRSIFDADLAGHEPFA